MEPTFTSPREFAEAIRVAWRTSPTPAFESAAVGEEQASALVPELEELQTVLTSCLRASLMRDEQRDITFRLILGPPEIFGSERSGHVVLPFETPRPFSANELRRLSPAMDFYRTIIGVARGTDGELAIWGLVHSGPEWIQAITGGRGRFEPLPYWPVISVLGPGMLAAARGSFTLAILRRGTLTRPSLEVFQSKWLPAAFRTVRDETGRLLGERLAARGGACNRLDPELMQMLGQHAVRRMISLMRRTRHGGALVFLPSGQDDASPVPAGLLRMKYGLAQSEQRRMYRRALLDILEFLSCDLGRFAKDKAVTWEDYRDCQDSRLKPLDDRLFEFAHLVSEMSRVDGAVVLDRRFELYGFGGEILVTHEIDRVHRALDADATAVRPQDIEDFGTRHRSAFRLCAAEPEALVVVVSQDGGVAFIKTHDGQLTLWDQVATSVLDI